MVSNERCTIDICNTSWKGFFKLWWLNGGCEIMDSGRAFFDFVWLNYGSGPFPHLARFPPFIRSRREYFEKRECVRTIPWDQKELENPNPPPMLPLTYRYSHNALPSSWFGISTGTEAWLSL